MSAKPNGDLSGLSMLDLFRMEVDQQSAALTEGLLALERSPEARECLEPVMRAAHSLKGAARIVGRSCAVRVAHAMEDYFGAAKKGLLVFSREHVDQLLRGVDILKAVAAVSDEEFAVWETKWSSEIDGFVALLSEWHKGTTAADILKGGIGQAAPSVSGSHGRTQEAVGEIASTAAAQARALRINADNLTRLLGLAGEVLISARWPDQFSKQCLSLRQRQSHLIRSFTALQHSLESLSLDERTRGQIGEVRQAAAACQSSLTEQMVELDGFDCHFTDLSSRLYREVLQSRMRPFSDGLAAFPRMVRDLAHELGKEARLELAGESTAVDRDILEKLESPLTHLLRNALDHGIEHPEERGARGKEAEGVIRLEARHNAGMLLVDVKDDGRGIDLAAIRRRVVEKQLITAEVAEHLTETELLDFLFLPGFSMKQNVTEISGRGVGLDIVQTMLKEVGGRARLSSQSGQGTHFVLELPLTLSVVRTLVVQIANEPYAFPLARIDSVVSIPAAEAGSLAGIQHIRLRDEQIGLVPAYQVFNLPPPERGETLSIILLGDRVRRYGLVVDRFFGERELVVLPLDPRLGKIKNIAAAAILPDRSPVLIADVDDIIRSIENLVTDGRIGSLQQKSVDARVKKTKRVLVVDDSLTIRELERKLLTSRGYEVDVAVDGMDGWNSVRSGNYDLVVTDVDMPRLDGIELVKLIKKDGQLGALPVMIVSYKDREEDRQRGLDAGADYYLTKASFHDEKLLQAVGDLIGENDG